MSRTFADLIRTVSRNTGDLYEGTLTGAINATTLLDSGHTEGDGWWTGGNLALVTAVNPLNGGAERSITGWTQAGGTYTTNAFPATPSAADSYEVRRRPKHTRTVVKEFINQAVREIDRQSWVHVDSVVDLSDATLYAVGKAQYFVPAAMEFVHKVLYQDLYNGFGNTTEWVELDQTKWETNGDGNLYIQTLTDYVDWDRSCPTIPDTAPLKFIGSKRPSEFVNETDINPFEGNYVEVFASARLCLRLAEGAQDESDFQAKFKMFYQLESDSFRGTRRGLPSGSRKVR